MFINPLSANPRKWSNTLWKFVGNLPTNCLSVFDPFVGLALKGLTSVEALHYFCLYWVNFKLRLLLIQFVVSVDSIPFILPFLISDIRLLLKSSFFDFLNARCFSWQKGIWKERIYVQHGFLPLQPNFGSFFIYSSIINLFLFIVSLCFTKICW